jgi:PIN domain nuclease of toxin-antitoxin system
MTALLDTHTFLWWITADAQLSAGAADVIRDKGNRLLFSAASAWELAIKYRTGKLPLPEAPETLVPRHLALNGIDPLPVTIAHALRTAQLPDVHRDPFDRLLVAQALVEDIVVLTADHTIPKYGVRVIW